MWAVSIRSRWQQRVAGAIVALCLVGIVGTVTRNVWLAAVLGTAATMVIVPPLRHWVVPAAAGMAGVALTSLLLVPGLLDRATARAEQQRPLWDRLNSDRAAWSMFSDRPLLGHGWGTFRELSYPYYQIVPDYPLTFVDQAHNIVLSHIAEMGVIGGGLWMASLTLALLPTLLPGPLDSANPWRAGLIAISVAWLVTAMLAPLGYAFPNLILWTWAGIVWTCRDQAAVLSPARQRSTAPSESPIVIGPKYSV
jgi:hypothetical protein